MEATKREWLQRQQMINNLQYVALSDALLTALWDAVEEIKPIQASVRQLRHSLAEKYALIEDGEPQTREGVIAEMTDEDEETPEHIEVVLDDYLQVQVGRGGRTILVEQEEEFREAMNDALDETVDLDVVTVPLKDALRGSRANMGELQETIGWIIDSDTSYESSTNGRVREQS